MNMCTNFLKVCLNFVIPKRGNFKYHRSIIQRDRKIDNDVTHRWWLVFGVSCSENVSLKCKFYRMVFGPTLLYKTKC